MWRVSVSVTGQTDHLNIIIINSSCSEFETKRCVCVCLCVFVSVTVSMCENKKRERKSGKYSVIVQRKLFGYIISEEASGAFAYRCLTQFK